MAQPEPALEPPPPPQPLSPPSKHSFLRKLFGRTNEIPQSPVSEPQPEQSPELDDASKSGSFNRLSRRVVAGLPRSQTFKRQQSEQRVHLAPIELNSQERRTASVDRRSRGPQRLAVSQGYGNPRVSAPGFINTTHLDDAAPRDIQSSKDTADVLEEDEAPHDDDHHRNNISDEHPVLDASSTADARSITASQYEALLHDELESTWILNLSMHFRDRSKREKFFVTYRESEHLWRRVTISLDYRNAPPNSLEMDLVHTEFQREKSAKIYEAIRESLPEIQFYDTVTNLKLQTTDGRLHVHVVEDGNEIILYPLVSQVQYLGCRRILESEINFEAHMSGFVYRVNVDGQVLIKKEIPSPETIDEFLYEVNALHSLRFSDNVVRFYGVVVDDDDERIKGLLISYAEQGALVDVIYDHCKDGGRGISWAIRERWARQIVQGLADIHETGFVQGDFTLSNIVIDAIGDAKIIDINRRGCPVGWEPPEAAPLIESNQRISMYIGVKSDLFQLGMVLWGLAMEEDEPELQGRPLILGPEVGVPDWYRQMTEICLSYDPRMRLQASSLLNMFPAHTDEGSSHDSKLEHASISVDDGYSLRNYLVDEYHPDGHPMVKTVEPPSEWPYLNRRYESPSPYQPYYQHTRGRSPPSPLPSNLDRSESPRGRFGRTTWAANINIAPSYSDVSADELPPYGVSRQPTPTPTIDKIPLGFSGPLEAEHLIATKEFENHHETAAADPWDVETPKGDKNLDSAQTNDAKPENDLKPENIQSSGESNTEQKVVAVNGLAAHPIVQTISETHDDEAVAQDTKEEPVAIQPPADASEVKEAVQPEQSTHNISTVTITGKGGEEESGLAPETASLEGTTALETEKLRSEIVEQTTEPATTEPEEASMMTTDAHAEQTAMGKDDTSVPRTVHVPNSLTSVGSEHGTSDAETMHDKSTTDDDDFTVEAKLDTAPRRLAATTETHV